MLEEFDEKIKREDSADVPSRADLPLPPSRPRDIMMEMQKIRESRDRFHIEGRTGGVGVPVSACMFTFHISPLSDYIQCDFCENINASTPVFHRGFLPV